MYISFLLNRVVNWLERRRLVNLLLAIAYSVFIILMHDSVAKFSGVFLHWLTLPVYNQVVKCIFSILISSQCTFLGWQLTIYREQWKLKLFYLLCTVAFILIHFRTMFEMNIEIIHIYEYPILCFLFFPFTRRFGAAVLFTLPIMLIDEWHQYMVLYVNYVQYFELNDVMIDIYGCGLATTTLFICHVKACETLNPLWKRSEFVLLACMLVALFITIKTCYFSIYPAGACSNTYMILDKLPNPEIFWQQFPHRDVIYHVSTPIEAVTIITLLCTFYFGLDNFREKKGWLIS